MRDGLRRRAVRRSALVLTLACLLVVALVQPAMAASTNISITGAQANASWTWSGATRITSVYLTVFDTACNASPARGEIYLVTDWGEVGKGGYYNYDGCGTSKRWYFSSLSHSSNRPILCVRVRVSTQDRYGFSLCSDNPST